MIDIPPAAPKGISRVITAVTADYCGEAYNL